jgi:hypothetical protein
MYEQAAIAPVNGEVFASMQRGLHETFAPANAEKFLKRVARGGMRVRDFEIVLQKGLLGKESKTDYASLVDSDRGLTREEYLRLVEQVAPELRKKYMKVYTYY